MRTRGHCSKILWAVSKSPKIETFFKKKMSFIKVIYINITFLKFVSQKYCF